ncbi:hypothetical protein JCM11641_007933 [Rhodosporidiobolus odoratus]
MTLGWIYHKAECGRPLDRFFVQPRRSILLSYVRHHLSLHIADRRPISHRHGQGSFAFRRDAVWRHMGLHVVHLLDDPYHRGYPSWDHIFTAQNDYLRKTTQLFALFVWVEAPPEPTALTLEVIDQALGRKADAISAAPGDLEAKWLLQKLPEGSTRTAGQVKGLKQMMEH